MNYDGTETAWLEEIEQYAWPIVPRGGQHVGMRCGVLVVHKPTGLAVVCESERSQYRNREIAVEHLRQVVACEMRGHKDAP